MDFYTKFRASPAVQQIAAIALAFALLFALLLGLYFSFFKTTYRVLFTNLRASDAATIVADLDKKKTPYRLQDQGATILVPSKVVDATRLDEMSEELPIKGTVGFELFNKSDMGLTEFAQKINYQRALQGELARTIMTIDAVDSARVHLSIPEPTIFRDDRRPPKASVTIVTRPGKQLSPGAVAGVRRLIAAAVPDLELSSVVILDEQGNVLAGDVQPESAKPSPQLQQRRAIEQYYTALVRQVLDRDYPNANAEVTIPSAPTLSVDDTQRLLADWAPSARQFPLNVVVSIDGPLNAADQSQVRSRVHAALSTSASAAPDVTDEVIVSPSGHAPTTSDEAPANSSSAPSPNPIRPSPEPATSRPLPDKMPSNLGSASGFWIAVLIAVLAPLVFLAGFITRRTPPPSRTLTDQEREDYVDRFRELLSKGGASAG